MQQDRTSHVINAGKILQNLSPVRLGTLILLSSGVEKQTQIADTLDCSDSAITTYLKLLGDLPVSLVTKHGTQNNVTSAGESVIELYSGMTSRLGTDLRGIDWGDEDDRDQLESLLSPLHSFRSDQSFLVLNSIGRQSGADDHIDLFGNPKPVAVDDIIEDMGEKGYSEEQTKWIFERFETEDVIEHRDKETTVLTNKGQEHSCLLERLVQMFRAQDDLEEQSGKPAMQQDTVDFEVTRQTDQRDLKHGDSMVPAYRLRYPDGNDHATTVPLPPTTTVGDLLEQLRTLEREYGEDTNLELFWELWTNTESRTQYNEK